MILMSPSVPKLRVFISWAGKQAEAIDKGFHEFLPDVVNLVEPFMSGSDIDKGSRWGDVLTGNLHARIILRDCMPHARKHEFHMGSLRSWRDLACSGWPRRRTGAHLDVSGW